MYKIALTIGDAAGVGPELILRSIDALRATAQPIVYGNADLLRAAAEDLAAKGVLARVPEMVSLADVRDAAWDASAPIAVVDLPCPPECLHGAYPWGQAVPAFGRLQRDALLRAIDDALAGHIDAICTLPWHKARLRDAGLVPTGHTEVLQEATETPDAIMVLCGETLRVALATIHIPLREVADALTTEGILSVARIFAAGLRNDWGIADPTIALCGLNPHAGENGVLGHEDTTIIAPAIAQLQAEGIRASGPHPADTLFPLVAHGIRPVDGIIAMYHDQGLGPLKTWHFKDAANVTVGMPILRTSVDHGTAYDIAGSGKASDESLRYAFRLAALMAERRHALRTR